MAFTAKSVSGIGLFGPRSPAPIIRRMNGRPTIMCQTSGWTDAAPYAHQYLILGWGRRVDLGEPEGIDAAVPILDDRLHRVSTVPGALLDHTRR